MYVSVNSQLTMTCFSFEVSPQKVKKVCDLWRSGTSLFLFEKRFYIFEFLQFFLFLSDPNLQSC